MDYFNFFLTLVLVVTTIIYAYLTYKISKSNKATVDILKEQSEAMSRPYIVIEPFVRPNTPIIYLRIKNTGKTSAGNLKLTLDKDFYQFDDKNRNLKDFPVFDSKIDSFAPNQELLFALAQGFRIFGESENLLPLQFTIVSQYETSVRKITEKIHIDLRVYEFSEGYKDPIVEELSKIREQLKK